MGGGGGQPHSLCCCPPIHTTLHPQNRWRTTSHQGVRSTSAADLPPQEKRASARLSYDRLRLTKDRRLVADTICPQDKKKCPSALSSSLSASAPPVSARTSPHCLAGNIAQLSVRSRGRTAGFYLGHTPRLERLKCWVDHTQCRATKRGSSSPSCVSHHLCSTDHVTIPGNWEGPLPDAHAFRRRIVCRSHAADFGGPNVEASPYPSALVIRGLAPSSVKLTGKPFHVSGLSWFSYSRPSHFSTVPGLVGPVSPVARLKAPHAGQVARSCFSNNSRAPWMGLRSRSCFTHFGRWRPCSIDNE